MWARLELPLKPGHVYRPKEFATAANNPAAVFERLEREGTVERLGYGLYHCPKHGRFGPRPPDDKALLDAFLNGKPWLMSGPTVWNTLRFGTTSVSAVPLVYNTTRSGPLKVGRRTFKFRRCRFPKKPTREWYAVDMLNHPREAGMDANELAAAIQTALREGDLDAARFFTAVDEYGTRSTKKLAREELDALRP